jgi:epoxide hydrolase-like predicted phosphatase
VQEIKAIGFDHTGVITGISASQFNKTIADILGTDVETFQTSYRKFNNDFNTGRISKEELWKKVVEDLTKPEVLNQILEVANKPKELNFGLIKIIQELKEKGYKLGLLTNDTKEMAKDIREVEHLDKYFDLILVSGETGLTKPDKNAYMDFVNKLGIQPGELIYIDDSQTNLDVAEVLGISGILYTNPEDLNRQLKEKGI